MRVLLLSILFITSGITMVNSEQGLFTSAEHIEQTDQVSDIYPDLPGLSIDEEEALSTPNYVSCSALELTKTDIVFTVVCSYSNSLLRPPRLA